MKTIDNYGRRIETTNARSPYPEWIINQYADPGLAIEFTQIGTAEIWGTIETSTRVNYLHNPIQLQTNLKTCQYCGCTQIEPRATCSQCGGPL